MENKKEKERRYRVIAFLNRQELDFLDDLEKDLYFHYGVNIPRVKLIANIIEVFREKDGGASKKELIDKMLNAESPKETKAEGEERRRYQRMQKNLSVGIKKLESLGPDIECRSENIGIGGLKIEVPFLEDSYVVNQNIELTINEPEKNQEPLKAFGKIIWMREKKNKPGFEIGIMLTYIRKEDRERFMGYLSKEEDKNQNLYDERTLKNEGD